MRPYHVTAPEARVVDATCVVDLQVTALDKEIDASFGPSYLSGIWSYRGDDTLTPDHTYRGRRRPRREHPVYPLDYMIGHRNPSSAGPRCLRRTSGRCIGSTAGRPG